MKTFFIVIAVLAVVVLIVVFRKQIGAFFSPASKPDDGTACTDSNGAASTYLNGVCKEVVLPGPDETVTERIVYRPAIPSRLSVRRYTRNCLTRIVVPQYPGIIWNLIGSNRFFCYYSR